LSKKKIYIANVNGYVDLCVFALICKIFREHGRSLGADSMDRHLEAQLSEGHLKWEATIKSIVDYVVSDYAREYKALFKKEQRELTPANYFKNQTMIGNLVARPIPGRLANAALREMKPA
jgi:hypothetical protein